MKRIAIIFSILGIGIFVSFAQKPKNVVTVNSGQIIETAKNYLDNEELEKAVYLLRSIPEGDTNYADVIYTLSYIYIKQELYERAIICGDYLLENPSDHVSVSDVYNILVVAYNESKQYEKSIATCKKALFLSPYNFHLHYNMGYAYSILKKYPEAEEAYKKAIFCNPDFLYSHFYLGQIYLKQRKLIPAILAFNYTALLDPSNDMAISALQIMDQIWVKGIDNYYKENNIAEPENGIAFKKENARFSRLESLVKSEIALNDDYKTNCKIQHIVIRQNHLIFNNLPSPDSSKEVLDYLYIPVFKYIMKRRGDFNTYHCFIFSYTNIDESAVSIKAKRRLKNHLDNIISEITKYGIGQTNDAYPPNEYQYNRESGALEAIGGYSTHDKSGQISYHGKWILIDNIGRINDIINTENSVKNGEQRHYKNGYLREYYNNVNNLIDGLAFSYYPTEEGEPLATEVEVTYNKMLIDGYRKRYNRSGILIENEHYKDDYYNGLVLRYSQQGVLTDSSHYVDGYLQGESYSFYDNGAMKQKLFIGKENTPGVALSYFINGQIEEEATIMNQHYVGAYKTYYANGQIHEVGSYNDYGLRDGFWSRYNHNGTISHEFYTENGLVTGENNFYSENGFLLSKDIRKEGIIQEVYTYNPDGSIKEIIKPINGIFTYNLYDENGCKYLKYNHNEKGDIMDSIIGYFPNGRIHSLNYYHNNTIQGKSYQYYSNGHLLSLKTYDDGKLNGLYLSYYQNDTLEEEGYYQNDDKVGLWYSYYSNGMIKNKTIYDDGEITYKGKYYPDGNLHEENFYRNNRLAKRKCYGMNNTLLKVDSIKNGNGFYYSYHLNGNVQMKVKMMAGRFIDTLYHYDFDGNLLTKNFWINGESDGNVQYFDAFNHLEREVNYKAGWQYGEDNYYEFGIKTASFLFENNLLQGETTYYFDNEKVYCKSYFEQNSRSGISTYYTIEGSIAYQIKYLKDEAVAYSYMMKNQKMSEFIPMRDGKVEIIAYYANEKKSYEITYIDGMRSGKSTLYYLNGNIFSENEYFNDEYINTLTHYYRNGKKKDETQYLNNQKHGLRTLYYENGTVKCKMQYELNMLHGIVQNYSENGELTETYHFYYGNKIR